MKIIKEYRDRGMKRIEYDCNDAVALKERFTKLEPRTIDELCQWLKDNNAIIDVAACFDYQSGWYGASFNINNADLSCNGYCLTNSGVELFINGGQNPMWYSSSQPEYEIAKKWKEANLTK